MSAAPEKTSITLPWNDDETITITGDNTGADHLIVHYDDGDESPIVQFLSNSLTVQYALFYEAIMKKYEARLKDHCLFAHNFPEKVFTGNKLNLAPVNVETPIGDKALIDSLIAEYNNYLAYLKDTFARYETQVEAWFNALPESEKA
jgi:hypothetical protein